MLKKILIIFLFITSLSYSFSGKKDYDQQIVLTLSNPNVPAFIELQHYKGSITVEGYKGDAVIVKAKYRNKIRNNGLNLVKNSSMKLSATEQNNKVEVSMNSHKWTIDVVIHVPFKSSLKLTTIDNGEIIIRNLTGEFEINNYNGSIVMHDISGSAVLSTIDGNIDVLFTDVAADKAMAFTSVEGDIDLKFHSKLKANLKMKSDNGEIYSDYKIEMNERKLKVDKNEKSGLTKYNLDDWIEGSINGGGQEILIKTLNGNIFIHKK